MGGRLAPFDAALIRLHLTGQNLEQGRLGVLILTDKGDFVAVLDSKGNLVQDLDAVDGLGHISDKENVLAHLPVRVEAHPGIAAGRAGNLLHGQLVQELPSGSRLAALGLIGREPGHKLLQFLDLFLISLVLVADQLLDQLRGLIPEIVVAHIHFNLVVIDIDDVGTDGVEEVAVVADHDDGAGEIQKKILQPVDGVNIQVVGGLVHHQNIGIAEQGLGQQDFHLETGIHMGHLRFMELGTHTKALQNPAGVGFGFVAAQFGIFGLEVGGPQTVLVGKVLLFVKGIHLLADLIEVQIAHNHRVHDGVVIVFVLVLLQDGHADVGQNVNLAGGGFQLTGENAQKRGFAGAVGADDAVAVALGKLQIHMGKQRLAAVL